MKIAIAGNSGFIGAALTKYFMEKGKEVIPIRREELLPENGTRLDAKIQRSDVVINLAGAAINKRWTKKQKKDIFTSRISTTRTLVEHINTVENKPELFISVSGMNCYDGKTEGDETTLCSVTSFLSKVCYAWEQEANRINPSVRIVIPRMAPVLARRGGVFSPMALPFRFGLGGTFGSSKQPFAWIHIDDLVRAFDFAIENTAISGPVNFCSPHVPTNREQARMIAQSFHIPWLWHYPVWLLRLMLGEMHVMVTEGIYSQPQKLLHAGFVFYYPHFSMALKALL